LWFLEYFACLPDVVYVFDGYVGGWCGCCVDDACYVYCSCCLGEVLLFLWGECVVYECCRCCWCEAVVLPYAFADVYVVVYVYVGLCYCYVLCGPVVADV